MSIHSLGTSNAIKVSAFINSMDRPIETQGLIGIIAIYLPTEHQAAAAKFAHKDLGFVVDISRCSEFEISMLSWWV